MKFVILFKPIKGGKWKIKDSLYSSRDTAEDAARTLTLLHKDTKYIVRNISI